MIKIAAAVLRPIAKPPTSSASEGKRTSCK